MVDSPYWKNDLSLEFWIVAALEVIALMAVRLSGQTPAPSAGSRLAEPK
jgi:hypothetical protein